MKRYKVKLTSFRVCSRMAPKKEAKDAKSIEEKYQKKTPIEHILTRPDTYIGEVKCQKETHWVYQDGTIIKKDIEVPPGLIKIFDEILVNACDHTKTDKTCDTIKVTIDTSNNEISVWNNGRGIDVEIHGEHKIYVPELIFGELLTSTNYDDNEKRTTGGRNGYGSKLTNIFSTKFLVETVDSERKRKFVQEFTNNMSERTKPKVSSCTNKSYTCITFSPDLPKFGLDTLTDDILSLLRRRVYDIAGTHNNIKVYLDDIRLHCNTFNKYIELYKFKSDIVPDVIESDNESVATDDYNRTPFGEVMYEEVGERWKVGVIYNPENGHESVSFVNSINTYQGGNHVNHVLDNIVDRLKIILNKKHKDINVKPAQLKENIIIFVDAIIDNPSFTSQTKETLKTKPSEFGSKCELSEKFILRLAKSGIFDQVIIMAKIKEATILKKTDGKKTTSVKGIPKLEDANWAGTRKSNLCYLILTEGDSAKAMALSGREVVGADRFGVFPLKGKLLNVREANTKQLLENEEIKNIKKIMGLQQGKEYNEISELRYGHIILLTDSDVDGYHISGLLMNFIHFFWPSLIKIEGFLTSLSTPIIKATHNRSKNIIPFYNLSDYDDWKSKNNTNEYFIKYYKGLGTSDKTEAKEYFMDIEKKLIKYIDIEDTEKYTKVKPKHHDTTNEAMTLAFEKKRSDDRKVWLMDYDKNKILSNDQKIVTVPQFINKSLIHFSFEDNTRSIPSLCDGFKPSQRKILYGTILRKLFNKKDEIRVAQLAGFVSDKACYHHGEASLQGAIINMAQDFVGSNNINILYPSGQFGSRVNGGKDAASPRYIHTFLGTLTRYIFRGEDDPILKYLDDDGTPIEPEWYIPILPIVLVNGSSGIGTGFSTDIPCYNPKDIIENIFRKMNNDKLKSMTPWFNKFEGKIDKTGEGEYSVYGKYEKVGDDTIHITELPVGTWTSPYKEFLEEQEEKKNMISAYTSNITDEKISFTVNLKTDTLTKLNDNNTIYQKLKLVTKMSTRNMHLYNAEGRITKYSSPNDILKEFYDIRLMMYTKRKVYIIDKLTYELDVLKYKIMFIEYILDKKIVIERQKKDAIIKKLIEYDFPQLASSFKNKDESYDYLTNMFLFSLTEDKIDELKKKIKDKQVELKIVKDTSEIDMWKSELNELLSKYEDWMIDQSKKSVTYKKGKPKKNKIIV